jgi:hypothetical protein
VVQQVVLVVALAKIITQVKCKGVELQLKLSLVAGRPMETLAAAAHTHLECKLEVAVAALAQRAEAHQLFEGRAMVVTALLLIFLDLAKPTAEVVVVQLFQ